MKGDKGRVNGGGRWEVVGREWEERREGNCGSYVKETEKKVKKITLEHVFGTPDPR